MFQISHSDILTERDVCNWLGISEPTLFRHRRDGTGPKFIRLSARRVAYRRSEIEAWLNQREHQRLDDLARAHARPLSLSACAPLDENPAPPAAAKRSPPIRTSAVEKKGQSHV